MNELCRNVSSQRKQKQQLYSKKNVIYLGKNSFALTNSPIFDHIFDCLPLFRFYTNCFDFQQLGRKLHDQIFYYFKKCNIWFNLQSLQDFFFLSKLYAKHNFFLSIWSPQYTSKTPTSSVLKLTAKPYIRHKSNTFMIWKNAIYLDHFLNTCFLKYLRQSLLVK